MRNTFKNYILYFSLVLFFVSAGFLIFWNTNFANTVFGFTLMQREKPRCNCYFPNEKKYGVKDKTEGCKIMDCEPPAKNPEPSPTNMKCSLDKENEEK